MGPGGRATAYCCLQANCRGQQPRGANANKYNSRTKTATTCCVDAQFCSPRRHGGAKMMILLHEESIENPVSKFFSVGGLAELKFTGIVPGNGGASTRRQSVAAQKSLRCEDSAFGGAPFGQWQRPLAKGLSPLLSQRVGFSRLPLHIRISPSSPLPQIFFFPFSPSSASVRISSLPSFFFLRFPFFFFLHSSNFSSFDSVPLRAKP